MFRDALQKTLGISVNVNVKTSFCFKVVKFDEKDEIAHLR